MGAFLLGHGVYEIFEINIKLYSHWLIELQLPILDCQYAIFVLITSCNPLSSLHDQQN